MLSRVIRLLKPFIFHMHNYSKNLSTFRKLQLLRILFFNFNQNNFVRKFADPGESIFLLCGTFGNSQIASCFSHAPLRSNRKQMVTL